MSEYCFRRSSIHQFIILLSSTDCIQHLLLDLPLHGQGFYFHPFGRQHFGKQLVISWWLHSWCFVALFLLSKYSAMVIKLLWSADILRFSFLGLVPASASGAADGCSSDHSDVDASGCSIESSSAVASSTPSWTFLSVVSSCQFHTHSMTVLRIKFKDICAVVCCLGGAGVYSARWWRIIWPLILSKQSLIYRLNIICQNVNCCSVAAIVHFVVQHSCTMRFVSQRSIHLRVQIVLQVPRMK